MKRTVLSTLILLVVIPGLLIGQTSNAALSGTITDASGALMPSVTVTATNNATGVMSTAISNDAGVYVFPSLLPGPYRVTATQAGFRTRTFTDVQLGLRSRNRLRLESPVAW